MAGRISLSPMNVAPILFSSEKTFRKLYSEVLYLSLKNKNNKMRKQQYGSNKTVLVIIGLSALLLTAFSSLKAQQLPPGIKTSKAVIDGFMDKRFGMFIHFGPVSMRGTEIGWSRDREVAIEEYDNLYKEFNPVLFNADAWVKAAKDAGMKYLTITAKHHDGFCEWPTTVSDYNIMHTPFKRDIVGELAAACKKQVLPFVFTSLY